MPISIMTRLGRIAFFSLLLAVSPGIPAGTAEGQDTPRLEPQDCSKCHQEQSLAIKTQGKRHRSSISCIDCHKEHLPDGTDTIATCDRCHPPTRMKHFTVVGCRECHPPHTPQQIDYSDLPRATPACVSCHYQAAATMRDFPSDHAVIDCKSCHARHGEHDECLTCHAPHQEGETNAYCRRCHTPHKPLQITYGSDMSSGTCISCHEEQGEQLDNTPTKHQLLSCTYCHRNQHGLIPPCTSCHAQPHDESIHSRFEDCNDCHGGAHNLMK